ncbi:MAG TPA: hypothetical protein VEV43_15160 [Actinomycetota bacterium]|nr:hypothetical protein [Actinomycetota bacterium]
MSGPPPPGHIRLYTAIRPALPAGTYRLETSQRITYDSQTQSLPSAGQTIELVAPRFRMSGSELLSTFPPAFAQGPFSNRFAQVALKRRTLPWERDPGAGADGRKTPWLMLVVLAKGEGELEPNTPLSSSDLAELRTAVGLSQAEAAEAGSCDVLRVTGRIVRKCFPSRTDLPYLAHVREVNLLDTETAAGDDDGFVAIVTSNRVLRGRQSYTAYLVSVEGQLGALQGPRETTDEVGPAATTPGDPGGGGGRDLLMIKEHPVANLFASDAVKSAARDAGRSDVKRVTEHQRERLQGWDDPVDAVGGAGEHLVSHELFAHAKDRGMIVELGHIEVLAAADTEPGDDRVHRFPVLAHWTFQTIGNGDFETVMRGLDVGLLGTVDADAEDAPTVVPTGHVLIDRRTRKGEVSAGWYRGPLVPHELEDRDDVPLHAAEQALRIGADGIEDLSYASAFELGRLMALADPRFVAALVAWRRRGATRRWRRLSSELFETGLLPSLPLDKLEGLGIDVDLVDRLIAFEEPNDPFGPLGPLVDPVPWRGLYDPREDVAVLRTIGIERAQIEDALGIGVASGFGSGEELVRADVDPMDFDTLAERGGGEMADELERHHQVDLRGIESLGGES